MTIRALVAREDRVSFEELDELPPNGVTVDVA